MSPEQRSWGTEADLADVFEPGKPESSVSVSWLNEECTRTGYTAYGPGQVTKYWDVIREPVDNLFFAGEYASDYVGYMEGAIRSGQSAAANVRAALK